MSKTRIISKRSPGSKGSSPNSSPLSARMSVSQSFHIKQPELIESIRLTENHVYHVTEDSSNYQTEFERRDIAASQIQNWWRNNRNRRKIGTNLKIILKKQNEIVSQRNSSILNDRETFRQRLLKKKPSSARVAKKTRFEDRILEPQIKTSRPYNADTDDTTPMKFSKRIQSSRKPKTPREVPISSNSANLKSPPNEKENQLPKPVEPSMNAPIKPVEPMKSEKSVDDQLSSLYSALNELEKPVTPVSVQHPVCQSQTDLKLARLEANLREMEINTKETPNSINGNGNYDVINAKAMENEKMMSLIFNENEFENEQWSKQVDILHSALKQQRDQTQKNMEGKFQKLKKILYERLKTYSHSIYIFQNKRKCSMMSAIE